MFKFCNKCGTSLEEDTKFCIDRSFPVKSVNLTVEGNNIAPRDYFTNVANKVSDLSSYKKSEENLQVTFLT